MTAWPQSCKPRMRPTDDCAKRHGYFAQQNTSIMLTFWNILRTFWNILFTKCTQNVPKCTQNAPMLSLEDCTYYHNS
ncbi:MAG: hypothetical protein EOO35_00575 [Cyanobacteriota bacterium]|nr:MAG: hypothetical protein EOO35_00575 [Cyanobacteriota bacterium]